MKDFLVVRNVTKRFAGRANFGQRVAAFLGLEKGLPVVHAVTDVSLKTDQGQSIGLVGESGCGKSTLARVIAGIFPPSEGEVFIAGERVMTDGAKPRKLTTRVQIIFQDPFASLNPRMRVIDTLADGPVAHGLTTRREADSYVAGWLKRVGMDPESRNRYPHQFSGGQRQRIAIARALAMQPDTLVCDEPVASLDVSIQAQIINLLMDLQRDLNLTVLFISHDLAVVRHLCARVAIMYLGRIVEEGPTETVYTDPQHPYTKALLESIPKLVLKGDELVSFRPIQGELPSPIDIPPGCAFHTRCPYQTEACRQTTPALTDRGNGRSVACLLNGLPQ
ncbi:MAG: ATP-binding cassette domain-containing protein [Methylobacteriaceae bacterium]|jgi:peptide/nickel transport system ATP-binding protein|nr:ATP-binding cassette domain-containing protein [Methylobacteriaceae bacterium]